MRQRPVDRRHRALPATERRRPGLQPGAHGEVRGADPQGAEPPGIERLGPRHRCAAGAAGEPWPRGALVRSEEHTSELQSLMRISYAVFCLKKKKRKKVTNDYSV